MLWSPKIDRCSGKPKKVKKNSLEGRKLKLREVAETLTISERKVFTISGENLICKLLSKWVPHLFTSPDQANKNDSLLRYVMIDKTWIQSSKATKISKVSRQGVWEAYGILFIDLSSEM